MTGSPSAESMSRMVLESLQEIVGKDMTGELIRTAFSLEASQKTRPGEDGMMVPQLGRMCEAAETIYGLRGNHGLILRTGRIFFKDLLRLFGDEIGIGDLPFRMLPKPMRIRTGIEELARYFSDLAGFDWKIDENERQLAFQISSRSVQKECSEYPPAMIYFAIGMLQEFLAWVTGGKVYPIRPDWNENLEAWQIVINKQYIS